MTEPAEDPREIGFEEVEPGAVPLWPVSGVPERGVVDYRRARRQLDGRCLRDDEERVRSLERHPSSLGSPEDRDD